MALYGEKEWYFFSPRDRKYPNGSRPNRAAGTGYWKATGADKPIGRPKPLGIKKALVFYAGKAPKGVKTNWIMHEYRLANVDRSATKKNKNLRLDDWVLCRIYNKKGQIEKHYPSDQMPVLFPEMEDKKPEPWMLNQSSYSTSLSRLVQSPMANDLLHMDTSDSVPRLHTESSCSEHAVSPEFMCEKEVQSDPKWNELENAFEFIDNFLDEPFGAQVPYQPVQVSPLQDIFMKPF